VYSAAWRYGTTSGCKLEGRLMGLDAGIQQPTACRKYEGDRVRRVAPKLIANGELHALRSREAAQLGASGLGSHVAVKSTRGWRGGRRTGRRRRATAERHAEKNHCHERGKGRRTCAPGMPAGHHGGKHLSGLDGFRVRGRCGVRVQRSHRRTR
jgi:hypothetical protein